MTDLTGKLISGTYKQLLQINASTTNSGITSSITNVQTGDGTNSALQIGTGGVKVAGNFGVSGNVSVTDKVCASAFYGDGSNITGIGETAATALTFTGKAGENITKGDVLYISGATGRFPDVKKLSAKYVVSVDTSPISMTFAPAFVIPFIKALASEFEESLMSLATTMFLTFFILLKKSTVAIPIFSDVYSFNCSGYSPRIS